MGFLFSYNGHVLRRQTSNREARSTQCEDGREALFDRFVRLRIAVRTRSTFSNNIEGADHARIGSGDSQFRRVNYRRVELASDHGSGVHLPTLLLRVFKIQITRNGHNVSVLLLRRRLNREFTRSITSTRSGALLATNFCLVVLRRNRSSGQDDQSRAERARQRSARVRKVRTVRVLSVICHRNGLLLISILQRERLRSRAVRIDVLIRLVCALRGLLLDGVLLGASRHEFRSTLFTYRRLILRVNFTTAVITRRRDRRV